MLRGEGVGEEAERERPEQVERAWEEGEDYEEEEEEGCCGGGG
jgi:hypothetical protein